MSDVFATSLTTRCGPGDSAKQRNPNDSLGGFASKTSWTGGILGDLFNTASALDVSLVRSDFRAVYVYNPASSGTLASTRVYCNPVTPGAAQFQLGIDPRPVTYLDSSAPQCVTTGTTRTPPSGVTFSAPSSYANGLLLGDLPPGAGRAVWFKRVPLVSPDAAAEAVDVIFDDGVDPPVIRRVYWSTEAAAAPTKPFIVQTFTPTPTPFTRVMVDYLTLGGTRVSWETSPTIQDPGPYVFTLQGSPSGIPEGDDWYNIGPPSEDALFLIDPSQRLWGMALTINYRVILTTAKATYVSQPAAAFGHLDQEKWLIVREVFRKEQLMLRRFTGNNGYLLKARRYGPRCPCTNPVTGEINNSSCKVCYGCGIIGGYQPAYPLSYANVDGEKTTELVDYQGSRGTVRDTIIKARFTSDVPLVSRDAWVSINGDRRAYVWEILDVAEMHGVPVVYTVELRFPPRSDILYSYLVTPPPSDPYYWQIPETITV